MQIEVIDHNNWEGENFSFVMEVPEDIARKIAEQADECLTVVLNTDYKAADIERINSISDNGYMDRIGFYEFKAIPTHFGGIYEDVFYKGHGLKRI